MPPGSPTPALAMDASTAFTTTALSSASVSGWPSPPRSRTRTSGTTTSSFATPPVSTTRTWASTSRITRSRITKRLLALSAGSGAGTGAPPLDSKRARFSRITA